MLRLTFFFLITISSIILPAQELGFSLNLSSGSTGEYSKTFGYGISYYHNLSPNGRIGINTTHTKCKSTYNSNFMIDGIEWYVSRVTPNNHRLEFTGSYSFRLINNPKSRMMLGTTLSLNYFIIDENILRIKQDLAIYSFNSKNSFNNRVGIGFLIDYEINQMLGERLSTVMSFHPQITNFEQFYLMGSPDPWFVLWLNISISFRYNPRKNSSPNPPDAQ